MSAQATGIACSLGAGPRAGKMLPLLANLALLAFCAAPPILAGAGDKAREELERRRAEALLEAGQRHLELGIWCRDRGLVAQASNEFLLAVEASENRHYGARTVLGLMRRLDDAFWKKRRRPSASAARGYEKKAREALLEDQADRLGIAEYAWKRKLSDEARAEYEALLRARGEALELDGEGRIVLEAGKVPAELSRAFLSEAVRINGRPYLRDEVLAHLPSVGEIFEVDSPELRVRTTISPELAAELHALGSALVEALAADSGARPPRRLQLFVFGERLVFERWTERAGLGEHRAVGGLADPQTLTCAVVAGDRPEGELQALVLHELAHLFAYATTRAVMPGWYAEGTAEQYGGQGSFRWEEGELALGGRLEEHRLDALREEGGWLGLRELIASDPLRLFREDRERALRFYAQSWAFVRFLREGADKKVRERFEEWEALCSGAALGAEAGKPRQRNAVPAADLFIDMFEADLLELERDFRAWFDGL